MTADHPRLTAGRELFDDLAAELCLTDPTVTRSTMMGFPCLRVGGAFAASFDHRSGDLVVKLPAARVTALVDGGRGQPFAPAGRVFREWVAVAGRDEARWRELLAEALTFAGGPQP